MINMAADMKKLATELGPYLERGTRVVLWMFLIVAVGIFLIHAVIAVAFPYPLDYGEAPLLDQAVRLARFENIYRRDLVTPPYTISNYPPLYPLVLAPLAAIFGPVFAPGRLVSLIATVASAVFLGLTVYEHSRERLAAATAGMMLLAFPYVAQWSPLLRIDMLALALSTGALFVVSRWYNHRWGITITAVLLVAATYTRQSYGLAAPLAAFIWLWSQTGWRRAFQLAASVAALGLLLFLVLSLATGGGFFFNIITANANPFDKGILRDRALDVLNVATILILAAVALLVFGVQRLKAVTLVAPYLVGATLAAATIGKVGSNINYLLELAAALSLAGGVLLAWCSEGAAHQLTDAGSAHSRLHSSWRPLLFSAVALALALQTGILSRATLVGPAETLKWRGKQTIAIERLAQMVAAADGPILADEYLGLSVMQHREIYLQPFELTQLANAGQWDQQPLLEEIRDQTFPLIMIHHFPAWAVYRSRWSPQMLSAILEAYAPADFAADTIVFRPRQPHETYAGVGKQAQACPDVPWKLPTQADFGLWWYNLELNFMGEGEEGVIPVYAVADGLLMRGEDWPDAVAIRHPDPLEHQSELNPRGEVWTYYGGMASGWNNLSFVSPEFPPGSEEVLVQAGDLLGYQGRYWDSGPAWVHLRFAILPALEDGSFPGDLIGITDPDDPPLPYEVAQEGIYDPSPYLGTARSRVMGTLVWLPPRCQASH